MAYARRMPVTHRHGEVEVVGRYSYVDLDDAGASGGTLRKWYAGLNWWATKRWKAGLGYGNGDLNKLGTTGRTENVLLRIQWIY